MAGAIIVRVAEIDDAVAAIAATPLTFIGADMRVQRPRYGCVVVDDWAAHDAASQSAVGGEVGEKWASTALA